MIFMEKKIKEFITHEQLLSYDYPVIVAVSGGVDSVCLLYLLHQFGYKLVLAHVNHHKRKESSIEQREMERLAKKLEIPFELLEYYDDGSDNFQKNAHEARYTFFKGLAQKYNTKYIATAHHLDDQAETILMRLLMGSNLYGYAGISIKQEYEGYQIVRPLLCVAKDEIYSYAKDRSIAYYEDSSNQSNDYLRNRIRHEILPLFKKETPNALQKLQEFSVQTKETFQFIRKKSIKYLDELNNSIRVSSFNLLDISLKKDILCLLFERFQLDKNYETILNCLKLIEKNHNKKIHLKNDFVFIIEYGIARICKKDISKSFYEELTLENSCEILSKYHFRFLKKPPQNNAIYIKLCYNSLKLPFYIRNRQPGDFIEMSYGNKKISRIFIDEKIPNEKRDQIPLIFNQDGALLWVYNLAKSKQVYEQKDTGDIYLVCEEVKA